MHQDLIIPVIYDWESEEKARLFASTYGLQDESPVLVIVPRLSDEAVATLLVKRRSDGRVVELGPLLQAWTTPETRIVLHLIEEQPLWMLRLVLELVAMSDQGEPLRLDHLIIHPAPHVHLVMTTRRDRDEITSEQTGASYIPISMGSRDP